MSGHLYDCHGQGIVTVVTVEAYLKHLDAHSIRWPVYTIDVILDDGFSLVVIDDDVHIFN